jgi:hypothetical protein
MQPALIDLAWTCAGPLAALPQTFHRPGIDLWCTWQGPGPGGRHPGPGQEPARPGAAGSHSPPACCFAARSMRGKREVHARYTGCGNRVRAHPAAQVFLGPGGMPAAATPFPGRLAISRWRVKKGPGNPISLVSADVRWRRGSAHATPIQSGGPSARAACRAWSCRCRCAAARDGHERPGDRRASDHLAARAGPGQPPRLRPGVRAVRLMRGERQRPRRRADHHRVLPAG